MNKYKAKENGVLNDEQAQLYGEHIFEVLIEKLGYSGVTPKDVVDDARDEKTPYHNFFHWDDKQAGELHRRDQARDLLSSIVTVTIIEDTGERKEHRALFNVVEGGRHIYASAKRVFSTVELSNQVIQTALDEVEGWSRRYAEYQELSEIHCSIQKVVSKYRKKIAKPMAVKAR